MDPNFSKFILAAPLISAILIQLFFRKSRGLSATISVLSVSLTLVASLFVFAGGNGSADLFAWLDFRPTFYVPIGVTIDELSKIMLLVVTGIGTLVHIYSLVYMHEDESEGRFFGNLSL